MRITLLGLVLAGCTSIHSGNFRSPTPVPIDFSGQGSLVFEGGLIDRGMTNETTFDGKFRYYNESWGNTLYLYESNTLKARVINPLNVYFAGN